MCMSKMDPAAQSQNDEQLNNNDLVKFEELETLTALNKSTSGYGSISEKPDYATFPNVLERPILIHSGTWAVGSSYYTRLNIGNDWFYNANISSKLAGWSRWRGDFKIIVQLSGSPFHYGELFARLHPLTRIENTEFAESGGFGATSHVKGEYLNEQVRLSGVSLRPGATMYVGEDKTAEIEWKFTYPTPFLDLNHTYGSTTNQRTYLGLELVSVQDLNIVTGAGPDLNVSVWVQAANVELSGPTVPQSATLEELLKIDVEPELTAVNKPVVSQVPNSSIYIEKVTTQSGVLDTAASVTEVVSDAAGCTSVTKKYTKAARNISKALKSVGLCVQTPGTAKTERVDTCPTRSLSGVDQVTSGVRTSLVSQGVNSAANPNMSTVDPLDIESLCNREMLARNVTWTAAATSGTRLWSLGVTPLIANVMTSAAPTTNLVYTMQYSPMGYIARMFKYWRGDIKFRIRVVCSSVHRGKLRLVYNAAGAVDALPTEGYAVSKILDLAETKEVEFIVPFDSAKAFIDHYTLAHNSPGSNQGTGLAYKPEYNGILSIFVMNELTSPSASSDVTFSIYISGHNMRFASPCSPCCSERDIDNTVPYRTFNVMNRKTGYVEVQSGPLAVEEGDPPRKKVFDVMFGEEILSLRDMIQRSMYCFSQGTNSKWPITNSEAIVQRSYVMSGLPRTPGVSYDKGIVSGLQVLKWDETADAGITSATYFPSYLAYVAPMFLGWKGGIRWTAVTPDTRTSNSLGQVYSLSLEPCEYTPSISAASTYIPMVSSTDAVCSTPWLTSGAESIYDTQRRTGKGYSYCKDGGINTAELLLHDYSNFIFNPTRAFWDLESTGSASSIPDTTCNNIMRRAACNYTMLMRFALTAANAVTDNSVTQPPIDLFAGAADDFQFFHFMTVPPVQMCASWFNFNVALA